MEAGISISVSDFYLRLLTSEQKKIPMQVKPCYLCGLVKEKARKSTPVCTGWNPEDLINA